jgi:hypothetical protein
MHFQSLFFETINAAGTTSTANNKCLGWWLWYFSPCKNQTTKENISEILKGYQRKKNTNGLEILKVKRLGLFELIATRKGSCYCSRKHVPVLIHVDELTQPQAIQVQVHTKDIKMDRLGKRITIVSDRWNWMIAIDITSSEEIAENWFKCKKEVG